MLDHQTSRPPEPWHGLLCAVDDQLEEPTSLICLGGFVLVTVYHVPRVTSDIDFISVIPDPQGERLIQLAGPESGLAAKYGVNLQYVTVQECPDSYEDRIEEIFPGVYKHLRLLALEIHDIVLSKLTRNSPKDNRDVEYLGKAGLISAETLRGRYQSELRPYLARTDWHDVTLQLWLDSFAKR